MGMNEMGRLLKGCVDWNITNSLVTLISLEFFISTSNGINFMGTNDFYS